MKQDNKSVEFKIEGGKFHIVVDSNKDGQPVVNVQIDLLEVPDEVLALFKKKDSN